MKPIKTEQFEKDGVSYLSVKWASYHYDTYVEGKDVWELYSCGLGEGMRCTAPEELPFGFEKE